PVTLPKAWKEMVHRYVAGLLGLLVVIIAAIGWIKRPQLKQSPALPITLLGLVIFQGLLGMWTVTLLLKPALVTAHLLGGLTTLALLAWLALRQFGDGIATRIIAPRSTRSLAVIGLAVLAVQVALGGWVSANDAALACSDFPLCQGMWVPDMDIGNAFHVVRELGMTAQGDLLTSEALTAIHWMHRVGALATVTVLGALAWRLVGTRNSGALGMLVFATLTLQALLGIANVYLRVPLALAVAHNAGAALLVIVLVGVNFSLHRARHGAEGGAAKAIASPQPNEQNALGP
ncbi:MAG: COX15/CtaA family protein, partial [Burkholderiales bacterium]|nr:COX15/CtaA family protein [Burkholderiales bacterium]